MTIEHARLGRRGWYGSWPQLGVPIGLLLSTGTVSIVTGLTSQQAFEAWGWRLPFLGSILLIGVGIFIRLRITESPAFEQVKEKDERARVPISDVVRRHPRALFLGMGARFSESATFNIYNAFLVAYVTSNLGLPDSVPLNGLLIAAGVGFFAVLIGGRLSDHYGRRTIFAAGAGLAVISAFPIFWMINTEATAWIWVGTIIGWGVAACPMYGPESAMFAEIFPTRVRYSGMSAVYQIGVLPSGAVAPLVGTSLVVWTGSTWAVAAYVAVIGIISVASTLALPETAYKTRDQLDIDAQRPMEQVTPRMASAGAARETE